MRIDAAGTRTDVNAVLAQMRALRAAAQTRPPGVDDAAAAMQGAAARLDAGRVDAGRVDAGRMDAGAVEAEGAAGGVRAASPLTTFGAHFESALKSVSELQSNAQALSDGFAAGRHQDLVSTMIAAQKASVAFQAATQVRNRLVTAYESIMNMPI